MNPERDAPLGGRVGADGVTAIVPAFNEEDTVADTVRALAGLEGVRRVVVVDDGSRDRTADRAAAAGAAVSRLRTNRGKAAAVRHGLAHAMGEVLLLVDADTGVSAAAAGDLLQVVCRGEAHLVIANLPGSGRRGGLGLTVGLARWGIHRLTGAAFRQPLSGQRAVRREVLEGLTYWGCGYGLEAAMTVHALRAGYTVREVPAALSHRVTGVTAAGFMHRGRQFLQVGWTLLVLAVRLGRPGGAGAGAP